MPTSPLVSLTGTTPVLVAIVKPLTKARIKKVMAYNSDTSNHRVQIGSCDVKPDGTIDPATFKQVLPDIVVLADQTIVVEPPQAEVASTRDKLRAITAKLEASASSGTSVDIVVEWEEA